MNRKLKALGLALFAAFALSAVGASGAMAEEGKLFHSEEAHTIIDAEATSEQVFSTTAGTIRCKDVESTGTTEEETVTEITVQVHYDNCEEEANGRTAHVYMNSCHYTFTSHTAPNGKDYEVHIDCTETGDEIEIKVTTIIGQLNCERVPAQTPTGGGVVYTNNGGHVDIDATVTGIEYTEVGACGSGQVANDGTYDGEVTVSGTDTVENPVGISFE